MTELIIILHNIRSTHNVGAILRTADGFGVGKVIISGYTPYPESTNVKSPDAEKRLPHIASNLTRQINKTALGAEDSLDITYYNRPPIERLRADGYRVVGLEQHDRSIPVGEYKPLTKTVLILGEEVEGISKDIIDLCDDIIEIPMKGVKESFNVSVAAGIALYALSQP